MTSPLQGLRILIIAGDPLARAGLAALLAQQPGCQVVGQAPAEVDLPAEVEAAQPDIIVWDLGWAPDSALERLVELSALLPPVLALVPDDDTAGRARAWQAGARGLIARNAPPETILAASQAVAQGLVVLAGNLADELLLPGAPEQSPVDLVEPLTPRENEVLQLLAEGLTNRAIATQLGISEHTVKFHVNAILGKLAAQSRADAVMRATRLGLILL